VRPLRNLQQAVDFSNVSFVNAPTDLFEGTIVDDSVACVNFTGANLSYIDDLGTSGFDFNDLTDWNGAVLAGAQLRFQDFSTTNSGDFFEDFFRQLGHAAASRDDLCSEDDNNVDPIDPSPDLRDTVFSCADIRGQDLSNSDLRGAEFVRTAIGDPGFDLTGAALQGADFSNVDFSENSLAAIFQGVSTVKEDDGDENTIDPPITDDSGVEYPDLRDVRLIHANLASLAGAFDLHHVDLSGAILDGADLTGADLTDAILDDLVSLCGEYDTAGDDPQLCPRDPQPDPACVILDNATLTGASFRNVDFSELIDNETIAVIARDFFQQVAGGNLNGTNFSGANLAGMNLDGLDFTDALSIGLSRPCDGVGECASFEGTLMGSNDPLKPMSLSGYDFQEASIAGARFTNVSLSFADLSDVGDLCTPESVCLSITGANSNLQSAILRDLDLTLVDFGTVDSGTEADDRLINFRGALFNRANLSGLDLSDRDFTGANFAAANLSGTNLDGAILASSFNGCERIDGVDVCTNFDTATMCGIDARSATLSASFAGVDAYPPGCSEPANFSGASFDEISLDSANLENAILEDASFSESVSFCSAAGDCVNLSGASLVGATLSNLDFDSVPGSFFEFVAGRDLSEVDFSSSDLSGIVLEEMDLSFTDFSQADLRNANLRDSIFRGSEFALGATTVGTRCELALRGSEVDLRGADLSGADFSRAKNFQRGCILVDQRSTCAAPTCPAPISVARRTFNAVASWSIKPRPTISTPGSRRASIC